MTERVTPPSPRHSSGTVADRDARYRALVEATSQIVWVTNAEGEFVEEQPGWADFTGRTFDEYRGFGWIESIHPDDRQRTLRTWRHAVAARAVCEVEYRVRRADGEYRAMMVRAVPVFHPDGSVREWVGSETDITDRRAADQEAQLREQEFRTLAESIPQLTWMAHPDGHIFWYNQRWYDYTGTTPAEMEGWGWKSVHDPAILPEVIERWRESLDSGQPFDLEFPLRRADGVYRWFLTRVLPVKDADGRILRWFGTNTDIDERRTAAQALRERADLAAFTADVGIALTSGRTRGEMLDRCCRAMVQHLDAAFARIWTLNPEAEMLELQASAGLYTHLDGPHSRVPVGQFKIGRIARNRSPHLTNDVLTDPNISDPDWARREGMVAFAGFPLMVGDRLNGVMALFARHALSENTLDAMRSVANSIALGLDRWQAAAQREQFVSLVENSADFIGMATLEGQSIYVNAAGRQLVGLDEDAVTGAMIRDYLTASSWELVREVALPTVMSQGLWRGELTFRHFQSGADIPMDETIFLVRDPAGGAPLCLATVGRDLRARIRTEQQLRQARQLQSVGALAGGVAHEVNNQMTAVLGFGSFALRGLGTDHPQYDDVLQMVRAAERTAAITQQLLAFSRRQITRPKELDLHRILLELRPVLARLLGADKTLVLPPEEAGYRVLADPTQLEQVLINLTANARDAMPTGGTLTLALEDVRLDRDFAEAHGGINLVPGPFVLLSVTDTGIGMDRATLAQIFEPFFTTKGVGEGTGLGLSTVYGIIKQHNGFIWAYSEPGHGTTMRIYLPAASGSLPLAGEEPARNGDTAETVAPGARGVVLLVEDDVSVRGMARRALEERGFTVLEAENGRRGIELVREAESAPQLVITDVVMPEMSGWEMTRVLRELHPRLPVVFTSGYAGEEVTRRGLVPADAPFLQKPFTVQGLVKAAESALQAR